MAKNSLLKFLSGTIFIFLTLSQTAYNEEEAHRQVPLSQPFLSLDINALNEVTLAISDDSNVSDLCDLSIFAGLRPGLTAEQVEEVLGPGSEVLLERQNRDDVYRFPGENGVIEIVRQKIASSDGEDSFIRWLLRARPEDPDLESHVSPSVVALLRAAEIDDDYFLQIFNRSASVELEIENSKVKRIWWLQEGIQKEAAEAALLEADISNSHTRP